MILFDTTKSAGAAHRSGLIRVSRRLREELGTSARAVSWPLAGDVAAADWYFTAELFSEAERPGFARFVGDRRCRLAAVFHDAIPVKHPHITWPRSVERHPGYMKLLAGFDRVWAVSRASKVELEGFWRWQGVTPRAEVEVLSLGADWEGVARRTTTTDAVSPPRLLCVGILEPRKNQAFLVDVCEQLWREGLRFELHLAGRTNPHFGKPILERVRRAAREHRGAVVMHDAPDDAALLSLYRSARATVFPTIAEGCGLPLVESLWLGVPCVCSDLPVLRENADGGGCVPVALDDAAAWAATLRRVLTDDAWVRQLAQAAQTRPLPTWAQAAAQIRSTLLA